jgi:hypothetical protein
MHQPPSPTPCGSQAEWQRLLLLTLWPELTLIFVIKRFFVHRPCDNSKPVSMTCSRRQSWLRQPRRFPLRDFLSAFVSYLKQVTFYLRRVEKQIQGVGALHQVVRQMHPLWQLLQFQLHVQDLQCSASTCKQHSVSRSDTAAAFAGVTSAAKQLRTLMQHDLCQLQILHHTS